MSRSNRDDLCSRCIPQETRIRCVELATAYVPFQEYCGVWSPCMSLKTGTAFPELFSPYCKTDYADLEPEGTCPSPDHPKAQEGRT